MKKINFLLIAIIAFQIFSGCKKNESAAPVESPLNSTNGVFITNEGSFGNGNGSVTFYRTTSHEIIDDVFMTLNNRPLGDVVQSMTLFNDLGFIVVNNSQTIEVVNKNSFKSIKTITGFSSPRFLLPINNSKAYVSDWISNTIKIVDLNSFSVTGSIATGNGPEQMLLLNNKVYVANVGSYTTDSTVTVIDAVTNSVLTTIQTPLNPNSIVADANGKIWVLCNGWYGPDFQGGTADDVAGALLKINPLTNTIEHTFTMGQFDHPFKMTINKDKNVLYFLSGISGYEGNIFRFDINSSALPATPLVTKNFYGLGVDPKNEYVYGAYSPVFGQNGYMYRFEKSGALKDSSKTGIGPNGFSFNY